MPSIHQKNFLHQNRSLRTSSPFSRNKNKAINYLQPELLCTRHQERRESGGWGLATRKFVQSNAAPEGFLARLTLSRFPEGSERRAMKSTGTQLYPLCAATAAQVFALPSDTNRRVESPELQQQLRTLFPFSRTLRVSRWRSTCLFPVRARGEGSRRLLGRVFSWLPGTLLPVNCLAVIKLILRPLDRTLYIRQYRRVTRDEDVMCAAGEKGYSIRVFLLFDKSFPGG